MTYGKDPMSASLLGRHAPLLRAVAALCLVLLLGIVFDADGAFFRSGTHRDALRQASTYGILACGMTIVILTGGIDLSVGSIMALVAVVFSQLVIREGWSGKTAIPACLAIGAAAGAISGFLVAKVRLQAFIATLAMMVGARGVAKLFCGGMKVSTAILEKDGSYRYVDVPTVCRALDERILGDQVAVISLVFFAVIATAFLFTACHKFGKHLLAIGGNEEAARLSGIPVARTKIVAYAASGLAAAIAGICHAAQEQQGDPEAGRGYELTAIAMVVIGGTSLSGGRGGIGLTLAGVLVIGYLEKILSINAVPEAWRLVLTGVVIVFAVLFQRRRASST